MRMPNIGTIKCAKKSNAAKYECECIECGYVQKSDQHCDQLKCSECGGQMRRKERPGPGKAATGPLLLCEGASVSFIEASDDPKKIPTFEITAYTGSIMRLFGWLNPVVIDLAGMQVSGVIPILKNHSAEQVVGHGEAEITTQRLKIKGLVSGSGMAAREVVESAKRGFPWKASVGAYPTAIEYVEEKTTAKANGKVYTGPVVIVRQSELGEVSFVPMAADSKTSAKIAALAAKKTKEEVDMKFEKWLEAKEIEIDTLSDEKKAELQAEYDAEIKASQAPAPEPTASQAPEPKTVKASAASDDDPAKQAVEATRAATAGELDRQSKISKLCAAYGSELEAEKLQEIQAQAVAEGWNETKTELKLLRAARPTAPAIQVSQDNGGPNVLEAALCSNFMATDKLEAAFDAKTLEAAHKRFRGPVGLQEFLLECAAANGVQLRTIKGNGDIRKVLEAAFSTQSAAGIITASANKLINASFMAVNRAWREIASVRPVTNLQAYTAYRLTGDMEYAEVGPAGDIPHAKTNEESYSIQAKTYGKMFAITRADIINDDLGAFDQIRAMLGRGAALSLNTVFWTAFMNNAAFFTAARNNYFEGAGTTLQSSQLAVAEQMFLEMTDADNKYLGVSGAILLVPPALGVTASELFVSTNINTGGSSTRNKVPNANVFAGKYRPVVAPYLSNSGITGYSSTAWYLLADPNDLAVIKVAFLNGQETPTVESADADFNTLGIQFRGYHDFGVAKADYYAGVKSKGAV